MARRLLPWLLALPLLAAGSMTAHSLTYRIAQPDDGARAHLLAESGHGYLAAAPLVLAAALALAVAAFLSIAIRSRPGRAPALPTWPVALVPPLGYVVQELLERLLSDGGLSSGAALEPTLTVGILLQLPFAALALAFARRLATAAERLGRALRVAPPAPARLVSLLGSPLLGTDLPTRSAFALGPLERGPPS